MAHPPHLFDEESLREPQAVLLQGLLTQPLRLTKKVVTRGHAKSLEGLLSQPLRLTKKS